MLNTRGGGGGKTPCYRIFRRWKMGKIYSFEIFK